MPRLGWNFRLRGETMKLRNSYLLLPILCVSIWAASPPTPTRGSAPDTALRSVKHVFIEKMDNNFDQDLRIQISRQFKGDVSVVLDREIADAILVANTKTDRGGFGWGTLKYLGLDHTANGTMTMVDKSGKTILWSEEVGDRAPWASGQITDNGRRTMAARLIGKLRRAMR